MTPLADLILVATDPLVDIAHLEQIAAVIKGGRIIDRGALGSTNIVLTGPSWLYLSAVRHTPFVQDVRRNFARWETQCNRANRQ